MDYKVNKTTRVSTSKTYYGNIVNGIKIVALGHRYYEVRVRRIDTITKGRKWAHDSYFDSLKSARAYAKSFVA